MIIIGKITRPFGMAGEIMVRPLTDSPERFCHLQHVTLGDEDPSTIGTEMEVEQVRIVPGGVLVKLKGIDTARAAQVCRDKYLLVSDQQACQLPDDHYFIFQIVGLSVVTDDGSPVGRIVDVMTLPANDVYVVEGTGGEILLPATREIVKTIDLANGVMVIHPVPGLLDS